MLNNALSSTVALSACIRCGDCLPVCPKRLSAMQLFAIWQDNDIARMQKEENLDACILCKKCDEVCPSNLPLSLSFAKAQQQTVARDQQQKEAARLKQRHQNHTRRLNSSPAISRINPSQLAANATRAVKNKNAADNTSAGNLSSVNNHR